MWDRLLERLARAVVRQGTLSVRLPSGRAFTVGQGAPRVAVALSDPALPRHLCLSPHMALGDGYMDGTLTIAGDDLHGLLHLLIGNTQGDLPLWQAPVQAVRAALRGAAQWAPQGRAQRNVAHHYDLSGTLYDLFLDADRQYSCAYFPRPGLTLDAAQAAKTAHVAAKLCLRPGMRVLDIGCGWGGLALALARDHGVQVLGVTLSAEQVRVARARATGLANRVEFRLTDYRAVTGTFDRIVSVGMFEHVGLPQYPAYFRTIRDRLAPDGIALVHTIGRAARPAPTSPWIARHIFPGGYVPTLSEMMRGVEGSGLFQTDVEVWRLHYAMTLRHWFDRFAAREAEARALYGERFCRMWRFYLAASEQTFRHGRQVVFQVQLARRQDAVPLTRDYMQPHRDRDDRECCDVRAQHLA